MGRNRLGAADDIDPARVDVADKRKFRKRKTAPMPENLKPWAADAEARMRERPAAPGVMVEPRSDGDGVTYVSPHDNPDAWEVQLADAFGTRSVSAMETFMSQLKDLCGQSFDHDAQLWKPNERELNAALNFVNSVRPENEAEAALAAQMLAVHWMQMRVAAQALRSGWTDGRDAAIAGKLARTYVMQMDALRRAKGKPTSSKQTIIVQNEKHTHTHQHVHFEGGGQELGGQAHAAKGRDDNGTIIEAAGEFPGRAALPGQDAGGEVVPLRRREGQEGVPDARRRSGLGRSEG